jgi:hypothetical protein
MKLPTDCFAQKQEIELDRSQLPQSQTVAPDVIVETTEHEAWLYNNKEALRLVLSGLADATAGRITRINENFFADLAKDEE